MRVTKVGSLAGKQGTSLREGGVLAHLGSLLTRRATAIAKQGRVLVGHSVCVSARPPVPKV